MFKDRHLYLGGSDIAGVLGISPFITPLELYQQKVNQVEVPVFNQEREELMYWGNALEAPILNYYQNKTGNPLVRQQHLRHPSQPFLRGHIDAMDTKANRIVEAKNIGYTKADWEHGIPDYYKCQVAFYCALSDVKDAVFVVLFNGNHYEEFLYMPPPDYQKYVVDEAVKFWEKVQLRDEPAPSTATDVQKYVTVQPESSLEVDDETYDEIAYLKDLQVEESTLKHEIDTVKSSLMLKMGRTETLTHQDKILVTFKNRSRVSIDKEVFKKENPALYEKCLSQSSSRYFLLSRRNIV